MSASRATATCPRSSTAMRAPSARARRSRGSSGTRRRGCTRSACASPPTSSDSPPPTISGSARCRRRSPDTWTRSTRWSTRRTSRRASTASPDPDAYPGRTVARALFDFRRQVKGRAALIPWLQDFSLARRYGLIEVTDQIAAAAPAARPRVHALEPRGRLHARRARRVVTGGRASASAARAGGARRARGLVRADRRPAAARHLGGRRPRGGQVDRRSPCHRQQLRLHRRAAAEGGHRESRRVLVGARGGAGDRPARVRPPPFGSAASGQGDAGSRLARAVRALGGVLSGDERALRRGSRHRDGAAPGTPGRASRRPRR